MRFSADKGARTPSKCFRGATLLSRTETTLCPPLASFCRQLRIGEGAKKTRTRKQWKDLKKKKRTTWGTGKRAANRAAKKAAAS